jgi:hypothetical protein
MATTKVIFALFMVLTAYELFSGGIFVRGLKAVKREEQPALYWAAIAFQTIGMLIFLAVLWHSKM